MIESVCHVYVVVNVNSKTCKDLKVDDELFMMETQSL